MTFSHKSIYQISQNSLSWSPPPLSLARPGLNSLSLKPTLLKVSGQCANHSPSKQDKNIAIDDEVEPSVKPIVKNC